MARKPADPPELLTGQPGSPVVYLLDAASDFEASMLEKWVTREVGGEVKTVRIISSRRGKGGDKEGLEQALASADDPFLIPLRVVWLAPVKKGRRIVSWWDVVRPGDAREGAAGPDRDQDCRALILFALSVFCSSDSGT